MILGSFCMFIIIHILSNVFLSNTILLFAYLNDSLALFNSFMSSFEVIIDRVMDKGENVWLRFDLEEQLHTTSQQYLERKWDGNEQLGWSKFKKVEENP